MDGAAIIHEVLPAWRAGLSRRLVDKVDAFLLKRRGDIIETLDRRLERMANPNRVRTVLSLFDFSGNWARAFELLGWNVVQVDLKHGEDIGKWNASSMLNDLLQAYPEIDGVIAAPPCTAFASSGARWWSAKDADGRTDEAVHLARQALRVINFLKPDFWALENPAGRIERMVPEVRKRALTFDPADFAGWTTTADEQTQLDGIRRRGRCTREETELVKRTGAYTKYTVLWGRFAAPLRNRVEPVKCTEQGSWLQGLGGACETTKAKRSTTPEGFALAFAAAQSGLGLEGLRDLAGDLLAERDAHRANEAIDLGNNETVSRGVFPQPNGTFLGLTLSASRSFKTRAGAEKWYARATGEAAPTLPAGALQTRGALAASRKGRAAELTHTVVVDPKGNETRVLCDRIQLKNIADEFAGDFSAPPTCSVCLAQDPRFTSEKSDQEPDFYPFGKPEAPRPPVRVSTVKAGPFSLNRSDQAIATKDNQRARRSRPKSTSKVR